MNLNCDKAHKKREFLNELKENRAREDRKEVVDDVMSLECFACFTLLLRWICGFFYGVVKLRNFNCLEKIKIFHDSISVRWGSSEILIDFLRLNNVRFVQEILIDFQGRIIKENRWMENLKNCLASKSQSTNKRKFVNVPQSLGGVWREVQWVVNLNPQSFEVEKRGKSSGRCSNWFEWSLCQKNNQRGW